MCETTLLLNYRGGRHPLQYGKGRAGEKHFCAGVWNEESVSLHGLGAGMWEGMEKGGAGGRKVSHMHCSMKKKRV